jgi:gluconolactonase
MKGATGNFKAEFEVIASGLSFPEGPIALSDGSLLVVEMSAGRLSRVTTQGAIQPIATLGGSPNGAALGPDGHCYIANSGGFKFHNHPGYGWGVVGQSADYSGGRIERVDLATGTVEVLYDSSPEGPLCGPNDLVFDRSGGFWFTDSGKVRESDRDHGSLFYAKADGSFIRRVVHPVTHPQPNGIGLSPDEKTLYYAETATGRVWSFKIVGPGQIEREPFPSPHGGKFVGSVPGYRLLDSLAVEEGGNICVGTLMDGGVTVFSPSGEIIETFSYPDFLVTNLCFGGIDMRTAFVTLSATGRLVKTRWPRSGLRPNFSL